MRLFSAAIAAGISIRVIAAPAQFGAVAVGSQNGKPQIAAGGAGGNIVIWDATSGEVVEQVAAPGNVRGLAFADRTGLLLAGLDPGGVMVWKSEHGAYKQVACVNPNSSVLALAVSPSGDKFAASGPSGWTHIYEAPLGRSIGIAFERSNLTCGVAFAPDERFLATAGNTFSVWDLGTNSAVWKGRDETPISELDEFCERSRLWSHSAGRDPDDSPYCDDVTISPDGKFVAGVNGVTRHGTGGKKLFLWSAESGTPKWQSKAVGMTCVAFGGNGSRLVTGSEDGTVRTWDARDGRIILESHGHSRAVRSLASIPRNPEVVSASEDGTVIAWDSRSGTPLKTYRTQGN